MSESGLNSRDSGAVFEVRTLLSLLGESGAIPVMIAKPLVLGLLAAACVTAAAAGAYVAVRSNEALPVQTQAQPPAQAPVAETEALVTPAASPGAEAEPRPTAPAATPKPEPVLREGVERSRTATTPADSSASRRPASPTTSPRRQNPPPAKPARPVETASPEVQSPERATTSREPVIAPATVPSLPAATETAPAPEPPPPAPPRLVEVQVPESSVVGLRVVTALSSETASLEDRVEARVTRDVMADGQLAIPAGSRVLGDVVTVERGGKMKEKARLGVRFHTLVLADGRHVPFRTDAIFREGSSPGAESARKIGGAAIGGAVLGAIIGGAKGAAIGGATGAAGGSAVVMAGDRNPATLPAGTVVTVRLTSPVTISVERES
jgi:hypothetical protein